MKNISYSDVHHRAVKLREMIHTSPKSVKKAELLYESVIQNVNKDINIDLLIKECSENYSSANLYARLLAEAVNGSTKLEDRYIYEVVPNIRNIEDVINSPVLNESFKNRLSEIITKNQICDKIYNNHLEILEDFNISDYSFNKRVSNEMVVNKICDLVNESNLQPWSKFQISILESMYIFDNSGRSYKDKDIVQYVYEYYNMYNDNNARRNMSKMITDSSLSYVLSESMFSSEEDNSEVSRICKRFSEEGDITKESLDRFRQDIMRCEASDLASNFNKYLNVLFRIILMPEHEDMANYILDNMAGKIYSDINIDNDNEGIVTRIGWQKEKVDNYIQNYEPDATIKRRLEKYRDILDSTESLLSEDAELLYSPYNTRCINDNRNELNKTMTLNEFKVFKFDNLITRTYKLDKYIQNKFEPSRQKIFKKIADKNEEIFHNESVYDVLTPDGEVDYCLATYTYEADVSSNKLNSFLTSIIMGANENILNETDLTCYYMLSPDYIEFHIKEYTDITLTDEERSLVENNINRLDEERMTQILLCAAAFKDDFDYIKDAVNFFSDEMSDTLRNEKFKEFMGEAARIGISKEVITEIYNEISDRLMNYRTDSKSSPSIAFRYNNGCLVDSYTPSVNTNFTSILEGFLNTQYLLEVRDTEYKAVNTNDLKKYGYNGEDEKKRRDDDDEDEDRPVKKPQPQESHQYRKPEIAEDDYEDVEKQGPLKNMTPTNAKLVAKGVGKKMTDFSAKEQRASRMADAAFNRLVKSCKDALVSDRREAIIKGSVIPSFSKSIKIAIALAALGFAVPGGQVVAGKLAFNAAAPAIAAIGGLIASKQLTERERSLLLDDIVVELHVIEKEMQIAESNGQMNKYRALMKMQKDLQRQYQRIRYNIKFRHNKNPLPSKTGVDVESD